MHIGFLVPQSWEPYGTKIVRWNSLGVFVYLPAHFTAFNGYQKSHFTKDFVVVYRVSVHTNVMDIMHRACHVQRGKIETKSRCIASLRHIFPDITYNILHVRVGAGNYNL